MEDKILKLFGNLEYAELHKLKRDLESGAYLMQHLVNKKITEVETKNRSFCAGCNSVLTPNKDDIYTLIFGETTIKKKASFCGTDCLNEFLLNIRRDKDEQLRQELEKGIIEHKF